jgi:hypothetical protein
MPKRCQDNRPDAQGEQPGVRAGCHGAAIAPVKEKIVADVDNRHKIEEIAGLQFQNKQGNDKIELITDIPKCVIEALDCSAAGTVAVKVEGDLVGNKKQCIT